jgi:hypothetical protein
MCGASSDCTDKRRNPFDIIISDSIEKLLAFIGSEGLFLKAIGIWQKSV